MFKSSPSTIDTYPLASFVQKLLVLVALIAGIYLLFLLTPILSILFFAGFLTMLFSPFLDTMRRYKIPNWLGLIGIFAVFFLFALLAIFAIVPIFIKQIALLFSNITDFFTILEASYRIGGIHAIGLPSWMISYLTTIDFGIVLEYVRGHASSIASIATQSATQIASSGAGIVSSLSGGIFQGILILVFTFFMSLERSSIKALIYDLLPIKATAYIESRETKISHVLASWVKGQVLLGLSIFALTLVGLLVIRLIGVRIEGIFTLALIAGLMEFIPYVGPFLALLPALAIAAGMGWSPIVIVLVLYIIIQQAENNIIVPMVMSKSLDLSPFLILVTMTAGASLFGIVGILIAIPFAAILQMGIGDFIEWKKKARKRK